MCVSEFSYTFLTQKAPKYLGPTHTWKDVAGGRGFPNSYKTINLSNFLTICIGPEGGERRKPLTARGEKSFSSVWIFNRQF